MTTNESPWSSILLHSKRRCSAKGKFDFFWTVVDEGLPALMLEVSKLPDPKPRLPKLKNLSASFRSTGAGPAFVLVLRDQSQTEIFLALCESVIEAGEDAVDQDGAVSRVLQRTKRWHHLLRGGGAKGLSVDEQKGLVGELAFLRELATNLSPATALEAWVGPTGSANDFELIGTCVEIKTRRAAAKPFIYISSAEQLADVPGSKSFLRVNDVASSIYPKGKSLHDHVRETALILGDESNVLDAWEEKIYATGYSPEDEYDDRRWEVVASQDFEITEGFPRLTLPLPTGIGGLRYSIALDACAPFKFEGSLMQLIYEGFGGD